MHTVCDFPGSGKQARVDRNGGSKGHNDMDATNTASTTIQYDDFAKLELRVATVIECKAHPNADKLLVLQIDLGTEKRQICAGLRQHYAPEQLVGKQIVVVANLAPRTMRGEVSQGMLLAATDATSGKVIFVTPSEGG